MELDTTNKLCQHLQPLKDVLKLVSYEFNCRDLWTCKICDNGVEYDPDGCDIEYIKKG